MVNVTVGLPAYQARCSVLLDDTPKVSVPPDIRLGKSFPAG